ncbi:hypothetical protein L596_028639 [Steinernema carpocapsae]|uniref:Cell growth-regulating nucleolar protein-like winged helix domain-containing protein n=1 Tax=Steinernema carpocapsae TaxID=34508 RepID=A0A4U5M008_STECR|nr:hypothetical protein L596_028639 [Steinernema carpocapsae]
MSGIRGSTDRSVSRYLLAKPTGRYRRGEVKQQGWVAQVQAAIQHVQDRSLRSLLEQIAGFDNIPRKEKKFINFLQNSMRIRNAELCKKAWAAIETEANRLKAEEEERKKTTEVEKKIAEEKKAAEEAEAEASEFNAEEAKKTSEPTAEPFKWKKAIKRRLKEADGEIKLKKLRKVVLSDYAETMASESAEDDESLKTLFAEKLESAGVVVEGSVVKMKA